jgi:ABC-type Fe3+-hydroxamate transport system substrate-binding protein
MPARRIVSLVPSQTELLYDLGLDSEVVGITKFCIHPDGWRHTKTVVGGTKNVRLDIIDGLKPDLILANKEENVRSDIETLSARYRTFVSDVSTVEEAYKMMSTIADLTGTNASSIIADISRSFSELPEFETRSALYLVWKKPWMAAGANTFISSMMSIAGFDNVITSNRYPTLSEDYIRSLDPQVVLLSSEPYPFRDQHVDELKKLLPASKVLLVDGEMFSWYGSRMREMAAYFRKLKI